MNAEQYLKALIGDLAFQVASLSAELDKSVQARADERAKIADAVEATNCGDEEFTALVKGIREGKLSD